MKKNAIGVAEPWNWQGYVLIGMVACAMLMFEILLTRICSLRLMYHFGYWVVGNCILAMGAAGTCLVVWEPFFRSEIRKKMGALAFLFALSLVVTYLFLIRFPLPESIRLSNVGGVVRFFVFNFAAAIPYFFAGGLIGLALMRFSERANRIYGVDLAGGALGCLLCPFVISHFGGGACELVAVWIVLAGWLIFWPRRAWAGAAVLLVVLSAGIIYLIPRFEQWLPIAGKGKLEVTATHTADSDVKPLFSGWSTNSRIDLFPVPPQGQMIFGEGTAVPMVPLKEQLFISQDCTAGTFFTNFSEHPEGLANIEHSLYVATLRMRPGANVFIIGAGGGNDIWASHLNHARHVRAIELNQPIINIHKQVHPNFSRVLLDDPNIEWINDEGRSALMHDTGRYNVIQMTGIDTWSGLVSGAYMLAENYLYTREAIENMLSRLAPGGVLQITRMAADMEALRMISNCFAAWQTMGVTDGAQRLMCLEAPRDALVSFMLGNKPFTPAEIESTRQFAAANGLNLIYAPGIASDNLVTKYIQEPDKASFIRDFPRDISPTTDDNPFFFNFTKWRHPLQARRFLAEPAHVSQGNPFLILLQLIVSALASAILLVLPLLVFSSRADRSALGGSSGFGVLAYFAALGLGFIFFEMSIMQKLTLFLGEPVWAITVILFNLLLFSGLSSLLIFPRLRGGVSRWLVPLGIAAYAVIFILVFEPALPHWIVWPLAGRILLASLLLVPISLLLGLPFVTGLARIRGGHPFLIPWAWAINACSTVVGSILSAMISINIGINAVMICAAVVYIIGFAIFYLTPKPSDAPAA